MSDFGDGEQEGTFSIFFAEGEVLAKQEQYKKAIESFTKVRSKDARCFGQGGGISLIHGTITTQVSCDHNQSSLT